MTKQIETLLRKHCVTRGEAIRIVDKVFGSSRGSPMDNARDFLEVELARGKRRLSDLIARAEEVGIKYRTMRRAATQIGVQSKVKGFGPDRVAHWYLPR